jgi:hypothetical protein
VVVHSSDERTDPIPTLALPLKGREVSFASGARNCFPRFSLRALPPLRLKRWLLRLSYAVEVVLRMN